jgi:hypothetical protein
VATNADLNSQHWNPAKYAFMDSKGGLSVNYTPWLTKLVDDINLAHIAGYYNMGDMAGTLSASFTYFDMGVVTLVQFDPDKYKDDNSAKAHPNEWAIDLAYSRKLHEYVSMAVALRFLYSDLTNGTGILDIGGWNQNLKPGWTMAADVALYYRQPISLPMGDSYFGLGLNLSNLGGKMSYDEDIQNFIPANMRLGVSYEIPFDNYNRLMATVECNKMLVPTYYSKYATDQTNHQYTQDEYSSISSPAGWWQSFNDAPGGMKEELREITYSIGAEYSYNQQFFLRAGYFHENEFKGNRQYFGLGAGFALNVLRLDASYMVATAQTYPLDQTLRFTLSFDMDGLKEIFGK